MDSLLLLFHFHSKLPAIMLTIPSLQWDGVNEAWGRKNYLFTYSLGIVENIKMHQRNPTVKQPFVQDFLNALPLLKTNDHSSSAVPHNKPLVFTVTTQRKLRTTDQDEEYSPSPLVLTPTRALKEASGVVNERDKAQNMARSW